MKTKLHPLIILLALLAGLIQFAAQATSNLTLSVSTTILPSGDRSFILHGNGPAGTNVVLEYTTNLATPNWTSLTFFTLSGQVEEAYDVFTNDQARLYRLNAGDTIFTNAMFQGVIRYAGTYPNPTNISYVGIDGKPYTVVGVYPGWLELIADPFTSISVITNSINSVGGKIKSAIPALGQYWIQVTNGTEGIVLSNLFNQFWVIDGFPAMPAVFGSANTLVDVLDWNDPNYSGGGSCGRGHMSEVASIAGRRRPFDMYDRNDPQKFDVHDRTPTLSADVLLRMQEAYAANKRVTINLSLQSPSSGEMVSSDKSGNPSYDYIREAQFTFLETIMEMLEVQSITQPGLADNTLISVIAGNAGVDLDVELSDLKSLYPDAFARVLIVGGTDISNNIYTSFNHLDDNTVQNMVYARAQNVNGCSGTSFAGPEVTSVLDAIWSQTTNKTSADILEAFHQVLAQTGTNNIIPTDAHGLVTTNFINQVVTLITSSFKLYVSTTGTGTGTVTASPPGPLYTMGTVVTLTAVPNSGSMFDGWSGNASGTGTASVTMTTNKLVIATFNVTSAPFDGTWSVAFSGPFYYTGGGIYQYDETNDITIQNGLISDGYYTGSVDNSGNGSWQTSGNAVYIFTGTFSTNGTASGTWTVTITNATGQNGSGGGTWTAQRIIL